MQDQAGCAKVSTLGGQQSVVIGGKVEITPVLEMRHPCTKSCDAFFEKLGHVIERIGLDFETQFPVVYEPGVAFGAGNGHAGTVRDALRCITTTDYRGDAQLARNDGRVAGAAAAVGNDRCGALHDGLPIRVRHVGYHRRPLRPSARWTG